MILPQPTIQGVLQSLDLYLHTHRTTILAANQRDLTSAKHLDPTLVDRLKLEDSKIDAMRQALAQ
ncbi:hypothetical protein RZS08_62950, partial [Arthrospira platensis SPKY1]|nr:hypothetical protein [Arthrospira platensis SPKY1]